MRFADPLRAIGLVVLFAVPSHAQSAWRADLVPVLDLSSDSKAGTVLFAKVSGATRLSNGTIVIADGSDNALHYFDATGKPLRTAGRTGSGPGEFRTIIWMGQCGPDSLHVWDLNQGRMSVFSANGTFVRDYTPHADTSRSSTPVMTISCSTRGVLAFQAQPVNKSPISAKDPEHPTRQERVMKVTAPVAVATSDGKVTRLLGDRPGGAWYQILGGHFPLPLGATTYVAVANNVTYVGTSDSMASIGVFATGGSNGTIRLGGAPRRVTQAHRDHAVAALVGLIPGQAPARLRKQAADSLNVSPMPATLPPFTGLWGDADGVLWVQTSVAGDPDTRLRAFGTNQKIVGEITLPANVTVYEIGRDYILGAFADADDVPHLGMFRLHRGR
jgi:hypothetical protein